MIEGILLEIHDFEMDNVELKLTENPRSQIVRSCIQASQVHLCL